MNPKNTWRLPLMVCLLFSSIFVYAQNATLQGVVKDADNKPLSGASVTIKKLNRGASAEVDGQYKITVPQGTYTVTVSFIGYTLQEKNVDIKGNTIADFTLQRAVTDVTDAVIVIGYGSVKKKDLTGAVTSVSEKDFNKGSITTPEQLIMGKMAGVNVTSNDGAPGSGSTIRVRNGASLSASNDPLIVIDGVPIDNSSLSYAPSPLAMINPNDIASMTILKDASSAAIYGSRASNGVILITTKKGSIGKTKLNFSTQVSASDPYARVKVFSADEYRDVVNKSEKTDFISQLGTANTDWQDEIYRTAISTDNNLSISGGIKNIPYRVSVGYLNQNAILKTGNLERYSAAINVSPKFFDNHLKVDINLRGSMSNSRYPNKDAIGNAVSFDPTQPVYSGDSRYGGYYAYLDAGAATGFRKLAPKNPVALLNYKWDEGDAKRSIGNIQLDYKFHFLPELRAVLNLGYDIAEGKGTALVSDSLASNDYMWYKDNSDVLHGGSFTQSKQRKQNTLMEFYFNYTKELPSIKSRIEAVAGYAYQDNLTKDNSFNTYTADKTTVTNTPNFLFNEPRFTNISYFGRFNYSYQDKYLLTGTIRRDGSSRFGPNNRWGIFPSGAFAWRISNEDFMKNVKLINDLKLRIGYGVTGQQEGIGNYEMYSYYSLSDPNATYQFGNAYYNMYRPSKYDPDRRWEKQATSNIGVDFALLNSRISGTVDLYYKKTTDLLSDIDQAAGSNFSNKMVKNIGSMENKGVEFTLNTQPIRKNNLTWDVGFNVAYNKNEITKLTIAPDPSFPGVIFGDIDGGTGNKVQINSVGHNRGSFYVYQQVYDKNGRPVEGAVVDRNKDGVINDGDLYHYKGNDPVTTIGFYTNVVYKQFSAGFSLRSNFGNYLYNNPYSSTGNWNSIFNKIGYLTNGSPNVLETGFNGDKVETYKSDYYIQNASFLRMDNINLGYDFGEVYKNVRLRLNANAQNVFVITKYKGIDPENKDGVDRNFYPRPRVFVFGLNLDF